MNSERIEYICGLIGTRYQANAKGPEAFDCWHLVREVRNHLFQDELPTHEVPSEPSLLWIAKTMERNPERLMWQEVPEPKDGSLVLMSRATMAVHVGIFLLSEGGILHTNQETGVVLQDVPSLKAMGWGNLRYFDRACAA